MPTDANGRVAPRNGVNPSAGTALVSIAAPRAPDAEARPSGRLHAAFLVHLIATQRRTPQTRTRRRADPMEAVRVYRAALAQPTPRPVFSRSL